MRIVVNHDLCEGHARCVQAAPEIFRVGDDDYSEVIAQPTPELIEKVNEAIRRCPRHAISIQTND
jgi:ferredoxin